MANLPLRALWLGDNAVDFSEGSMLDTDLILLTVISMEVRLPIGFNEKYAVKAELRSGGTYAGEVTSKMPRDVGGRNLPTAHIYEFVAAAPLAPAV